jgi:hypothetical protein
MMALLLSRKVLVRGADLLPWVSGALCLGFGLSGRPGLTLLGSAILIMAGITQVASANGYTPPRPGRVPILMQGCHWDVPQAFYVEYRGHGFLFFRAFHPVSGELPEEYSVIAVPPDCDGETLRYSGFVPPEDSRLLGTVPTRELQFDHDGGHYVDKASLSSALRRLEVAARSDGEAG